MSLELLAPAGSPASLRAAVEAGADAVYMGAFWNARMRGRNFSQDELAKAIAYCRKEGVKSCITLNILAQEEELRKIKNYVKEIYEFGADAFIVQDLGVARIVQEVATEAELHASTQMSLHNSKTAKILKGLGFERAVLARELSAEQAKKIKENSGMGVEVFAHGALCYSYSGKCLFSFVQSKRSANRGACAQMCRLPFKLFCNGKQVKEGYLTSTKDLNLAGKIPEIKKAGIDCIKIEGRLKGAEYVGSVVKAYRKAIDTGENVDLSKFTSRGYTGGYLFSDAGRNGLLNPKRSEFAGKRVGKVVKTTKAGAIVKLSSKLRIGDSVRSSGSGKVMKIHRMYENGKEVRESSRECVLKIKSLSKGNSLNKVAQAKFEDEFLGKVGEEKIRESREWEIEGNFFNYSPVPKLVYMDRGWKDFSVPKGSLFVVPWERAEEGIAKSGGTAGGFAIRTPRVIFDEEMESVEKKMKELADAGPYAFMVSELCLAEKYPIIVSQYANVSNTLSASAWGKLGDVKGIVAALEVSPSKAKKIGFIPFTGRQVELMISENDFFNEHNVPEGAECELVDPNGNRYPVIRRNGRTVVLSPKERDIRGEMEKFSAGE